MSVSAALVVVVGSGVGVRRWLAQWHLVVRVYEELERVVDEVELVQEKAADALVLDACRYRVEIQIFLQSDIH